MTGRDAFGPALSKVFGSKARTELVAVLAERHDDWLTAAELCDRADVSRSGFHRDHKSVLLDFGFVRRREGDGRTLPKYTLADTEQADLAARLHHALEAKGAQTGSYVSSAIEGFTE